MFVAEVEHSDGIISFVLTQDAPMPWPVFFRAMDTLMAMRGPDLLRVKGFLSVENCAGPVVVQFVQHLAHPPVELQTWPDDNPAKPRGVYRQGCQREASARFVRSGRSASSLSASL